MSGDDVRELQVGLLLLGYFPGEADGVYGPRTVEAVRRFQVDYGLAGDGVVSRDTWRSMADLYAEMAGRSPRPDQNPPPPHLEDTEAPPGPENISLLVDTDARTLSVMHGTTIIRQYRVAVGKESSPTPHGDWFIKEKDTWAGAFGTRWMRLSIPWGIYGLHGTNKPWSIGSYASHGCIRMLNREVEEVFQVVSVGTPIRVVGKPEAQYGEVKRYIVQTHRGSDVLAMQCRLIELGYDPGIPDGIFGPDTTRALLQFQRDLGLKADGVVDEATGRALDLW
jgi:peptidoglycan hydrolase-like protein with peptidoglycan-binding domain